ncbi:ribonucleoside-diphosphate reductase alpha chain [Bacilli bacterium PM5-3]|nr:ribonucleoside-diphosphate reductase alpha chain [Bacilli bacterium PM5-3]MDH6603817.1 ribonucleoside-diphosphate reductase alpha chain [Bacilli bacterium PM5-9]
MYSQETIKNLNNTIKEYFPHLYPIEKDYNKAFENVSRLVMLDRYSQKDRSLETLQVNDLVIVVLEHDPTFPSRGIGYVSSIDGNNITVDILEDYRNQIKDDEEYNKSQVVRKKSQIEKPLEIYFEQIAKRIAVALASGENSQELKDEYSNKFFDELKDLNIVPAGRVLFGAGSGSNVTYFNCFVMPFIDDSRGGISEHRKEVMEIMSRGGGVGTNGSTLRPKHAVAKDVGGRSSGAVSWLHDLSNLTHLVEQGGSRRGAQMIMMADWHPDIIEFIISKMQNPMILEWLKENSKDEDIVRIASEKLKFVPIDAKERAFLEDLANNSSDLPSNLVDEINQKLLVGGHYEVENKEFLSGANISVTITKEFMEAIENDSYFELRYPDLDNLTSEQKTFYDTNWREIGDVREWEKLGYPVKVYRSIKARELWNLISFCATYSAEPGIFFIDNANDMTNAKAYGQKVVATNPCGEQPLSPYSVCNLAAINLANFINKETKEIQFDKLRNTVSLSVRMQDNIIDQTPYFLEANEKQALGERRVGLGVMGLHDLLLHSNLRYGSKEANVIVEKIFKEIAETAYKTSIDLAKEKGSFPFLKDNREAFINSGFMKQMNQDIRNDILKYGIRNSHLLTIAPTGSTGTMVGVSTGLEPYFSFKFYRSGRLGKFIEVNAAIVDEWLKYNPDYTADTLPDFFVGAMDLTPEEHVDTQCIIQKWIDSSISKTVNAPKGYSVVEVQKLYEKLYKGKAKGGTVYVDGSRDSQVLSLTNDEAPQEQLVLSEEIKPSKNKETTELRADRQDRNIGTEIGDICPICLEGTVEEIGGCNTCTNCNAQLKCGL